MNFLNLQASPAFQHLSAILSALDLPQPTKEASVFDLLSDIEKEVTKSMLIFLLLFELHLPL